MDPLGFGMVYHVCCDSEVRFQEGIPPRVLRNLAFAKVPLGNQLTDHNLPLSTQKKRQLWDVQLFSHSDSSESEKSPQKATPKIEWESGKPANMYKISLTYINIIYKTSWKHVFFFLGMPIYCVYNIIYIYI